MSRWYRFLYKVGLVPWETDTDAVWPQLRRLLEVEEADRGDPYGRALDLGCGRGRWSIELAKRGWRVTGIDVVEQAVQAARQRAQEAGVSAEFVTGDVAALSEAGIGSSFSFFVDVECFNHLTDEQRIAVGREVDAVAEPGATLLLLGWRRAARGPLPPGVETDDLRAAFPNWGIVSQEPYEAEMPLLLRGASPRWYRLRK